MPIISIIMPAYNVEGYIEKTIQLIQRQTFKDFELLIVDDGSSDNTYDLCKKYVAQDSRIKILHKDNGGVSAARNYGLDRITGQFMTFIDSDDWITDDYLQYLYSLILEKDDVQISMLVGKQVSEKSEILDVQETFHEVISAKEAIIRMLTRDVFTHENWGKLYRVDLWRNIRFPEDIIYDDLNTTYRVFAEADKVACGNAIKYSYVQRAGSLMHSKCSKRTLSVLDVVDDIAEYLVKRWPDIMPYAVDMQVQTYMKNLQMILNSGTKEFEIEEERILSCVRRNASLLLINARVPRNDKIKVLTLLINKRLFLWLYNLCDGNIKVVE